MRSPAAEAAATSRNPFTSPLFARWWLASVFAGTGVGIQTVTVPLFIRDRVDLDARALAIAAALVVQTLPAALLVLVGGAVADRVERRRILVRTYSLAAVVSSAYVLLSGLDVRSIWPVFPLAATVGAANAFASPARQSLLPQLVSRAQLQNGVIFGTMGFIATLQFLGPSLAGILVDLRGLTTAFSVEVALLAAGAAVYALVHTGPPTPTGVSVRQDLVDGVRYVLGEPAIRGLIGLGSVVGVCFIGSFSVTVPLLVPDVLGASDKWVGLLWGCFGGGVFAGSLALTVKALPRRGLAACSTIFFGGILFALYGSSEVLWLSAVLQVLAGLNASVFMNYVVTLLQERSEPRMLGRVMSMYTLVFFASMPVGYAQAGAVTSLFGPQASLVASGLVAAVIGLGYLALLEPVRALR